MLFSRVSTAAFSRIKQHEYEQFCFTLYYLSREYQMYLFRVQCTIINFHFRYAYWLHVSSLSFPEEIVHQFHFMTYPFLSMFYDPPVV
jgi:hypothetical protein